MAEGARVVGLHGHGYLHQTHEYEAEQAAAAVIAAAAAEAVSSNGAGNSDNGNDATSGNSNNGNGTADATSAGSSGNGNGSNGADEKNEKSVCPLIPNETPSDGGGGGAMSMDKRLPRVHEEDDGTPAHAIHVNGNNIEHNRHSGAPIISHTFNSGMYRKVELRSNELLSHLIEVARLRDIANKERAQAAGVVTPLPQLNTDASGMMAAAPSPAANNNNNESASGAAGGATASGIDSGNEDSSAAFSNSPANAAHGNGGTPRASSLVAGSSGRDTPTAGMMAGGGRATPPLHPRMPSHFSHHSLSNAVAMVMAAKEAAAAAAPITSSDNAASTTTSPPPVAPIAAGATAAATTSSPSAAAAVVAANFVRRVSRATHDVKSSQARAFDRRHPPILHWLQIPRADRSILKIIGEHYRLSEKQIDNIMDLDQLPSVDGYDNNLAFVFHMQGLLDETKITIHEEQMTVIFLHELQTVITVNESPKLADCFDRIFGKLSFERSKIRLLNDASFLCYSFVDAVVDYTFPILEKYARQINWLEKDMLSFEPLQEHMDESGVLKSNLLAVRMNLWRLRELLTELIQDEYNCISTESKKYMRDVYIHTENMVEVVESQLELCQGLLSIYNNFQGGKTNSTVAMLTNLTAILLPAQFLTGVYGQNFEILPELHWTYSYLMFWVVVILLGLVTSFGLWRMGAPMKRKPVPQHLKESGKTLKRRTSVSSIKLDNDNEEKPSKSHAAKSEAKRPLHKSSTPDAAAHANDADATSSPLITSGTGTAASVAGSSGRRPLMIGTAPPLLSAGSARLLIGKDFGVELSTTSIPQPLPVIEMNAAAASRYEVPGAVHDQ